MVFAGSTKSMAIEQSEQSCEKLSWWLVELCEA